MMDKKHIAEVEKAFKKALTIDRARIQLSRISKFGMLELSRQKKQSTIQEISYTTCPYCKGSGLRPSLEYASLGAFRKIETEVVKGNYSELRIILPHEIASYILNHKRSELIKLESTFDLIIHISGSTEMPWDKQEIHHTVKEVAEHVSEQPDYSEETARINGESIPPVIEENGSITAGDAPKKKSRRRNRGRKRKPLETKTESALLDGMPPVTTTPEMEVTQNGDMLESIPPMVSMPLFAESAGQEQSVPKAALLIQPAEHTEVEPAAPEQDPVTVVFEAEKKDEDL